MRILSYMFAMAMCAVFHCAVYAEPAIGTLQVSLVDAAGKPVPGAVVFLRPGLAEGDRTPVGRCKANAMGIAIIPEIVVGKYHLSVVANSIVQAHGEQDIEVSYPVDSHVCKTTMRLIPSATIEGVVVGTDGKPIPAANVDFFKAGSPQRVTVCANAQGEIAVVGLWEGETYSYAIRSPNAARSRSDSTDFVAQDGAEMTLVAKRIVHGPLPVRFAGVDGKQVAVTGMLKLGPTRLLVIDGGGQLREIVEGSHKVELGGVQPLGWSLATQSQALDVTADMKEIVVVLEAGFPIVFDLNGKTGAPLPATVLVYSWTDAIAKPSEVRLIQNDGKVSTSLAPGTYHLALAAKGFSTWFGQIELDPDVDRSAPRVVEVALKPPVSLDGLIPTGIDVMRVRIEQPFGDRVETPVTDGAFHARGLSEADTTILFFYESGTTYVRKYGPDVFRTRDYLFDLPPVGELVLNIDVDFENNDLFAGMDRTAADADYGELILLNVPDGQGATRVKFVPGTDIRFVAPMGDYVLQWRGGSAAYNLGPVEIQAHSVQKMHWNTAEQSKFH